MQTVLKWTAKVLPGSRVEVAAPELPEGADVEVLILLPESPDASVTDTEARFAALADRWRQETALLSSASQTAMHPAYQEIIGMGRTALPLVLRDMKRQPGHWFWALRAITGEDPVESDQRGNVRAMTDAWLSWGRERGHVE